MAEEDAAPPLDGGRYRLVSLLGEGGMAAVYRAWDERLQAWRAIKVLKPEAAAHASVRARFLDEARAMARLHHPNILTVHDVGSDESRPFMVMELVAGGALIDEVDDSGPLSPAEAAALMAEVLDGLHFAHEHHVVHRDIKPHNLLRDAHGRPLIADFGIARIGGDSDRGRTRTGAMMGTLAYMAPEQRASARDVDGRADVYACGNTLYALVTGDEPFDLYVATDDDPQLARIPAALRDVIRRATRHKPEDRYATAAEMAEALRAIPQPLSPEALQAGSPAPSDAAATTSETFALEPRSSRSRRSSGPWMAVLVSLAVLLTGAACLVGMVGASALLADPETTATAPVRKEKATEKENQPPRPDPEPEPTAPAPSEPVVPARPPPQPDPTPDPAPVTRPPPRPPSEPEPPPEPERQGPTAQRSVMRAYRQNPTPALACFALNRKPVSVTVHLDAVGRPARVQASSERLLTRTCLEGVFKGYDYIAPRAAGAGTVSVDPGNLL